MSSEASSDISRDSVEIFFLDLELEIFDSHDVGLPARLVVEYFELSYSVLLWVMRRHPSDIG